LQYGCAPNNINVIYCLSLATGFQHLTADSVPENKKYVKLTCRTDPQMAAAMGFGCVASSGDGFSGIAYRSEMFWHAYCFVNKSLITDLATCF